jgi:alpha-glucan,water dikinase
LSSNDVVRATFGLVGKGSGNGQEVRDEILHIMHRHHIKENKGGADAFYEEWHQKLHNNTTPDDIPICEALLAYLKTSDMSEYWRVLDDAGITKERLLSYERNITTEPSYRPETIGSFENYLTILKKMHSSDDLLIQMDELDQKKGNSWHAHHYVTKVKENMEDEDVLAQMDRVL